MDPDVEFFGIEIPPGATIPLGAGDGDDDDGVALVHATQAALGPSPSPGRHTVFVVRDGVKTPVGTLVEGRCKQFALDLMWSALAGAPPGADVAVCHSGPSPVYVSGYKTVTSLLDGGSDGGEPEFETESESEEDEEAARPRERVKGGKVRDMWGDGGWRRADAAARATPARTGGRRGHIPRLAQPAKGPAVRDFSDMSDGGSEVRGREEGEGARRAPACGRRHPFFPGLGRPL